MHVQGNRDAKCVVDLVQFIEDELSPQLIIVKNTAFVKKIECDGRRNNPDNTDEELAALSVLSLTKPQRNKLDYVVFPNMASAILKICQEQAQELSLSPKTATGACKWPPLLQLSAAKEVQFGSGETCRTVICRSALGLPSTKSRLTKVAAASTESISPEANVGVAVAGDDGTAKANHVNAEGGADLEAALLAKATASAYNTSLTSQSCWSLVPHESGEMTLHFSSAGAARCVHSCP
jgi:hypothetical protein